mgnify:CR=1 FL=1
MSTAQKLPVTERYRHLFRDLEDGLLAEMQATGRIMEVKAGETLLQTGQYLRSTMIVLEGIIKLLRENDEGNEFFMYHLHPGEGCALSLICDRSTKVSSVTARAVTDSVLLILPLLALGVMALLPQAPVAADTLLVFATLPVASSAYILAQRMGGDGATVAWVISVSTVLAAFTMPLWLALSKA